MATTTNYGWATPDDTALVKDGAAAIRTLGSSVDTTTKALNPSTTLGDIEYRSSTANTNTRLAIGSNGQVLTVTGGVPTWSTAAGGGGMTLISTTTLSAASTTISFTPTDYIDLAIRCSGLDTSTNASLIIRLNGDSGNNYYNLLGYKQGDSGTPGFDASFAGGNNIPRSDLVMGGAELSNFNLTIFNCNDTSNVTYNFSGIAEDTSNDTYGLFGMGRYDASAAITSITILNNVSTSMTGTVRIYGVK
jgi:hypothetical protein